MCLSNSEKLRVETMERATFLEAARGSIPTRRKKLWEVEAGYLCPLIGTCLPMAALRRLARRAALEQAGRMSDYELHHAAVHLAGARNEFSRLAHKDFDTRYAAALARFAHADGEPALLALWKTALAHGDVAGALWALMTHPRASQRLLQLASQEVHMLSHQAGAAGRADLRRLATLEQENRALRARLEDQHCATTHRLALKEERIAALERHLAEAAGTAQRLHEAERRLQLQPHAVPAPARQEEDLSQRLAHSEARCARLERALVALRAECEATERALGALLKQPAATADANLGGRRVLYVGGRTGLVEQYRQVVERHGGALVHHDGGLEHSLKRLPPLLAAADMVVCAAGETSHAAYYIAKRSCKRAGKPCALLRRASLASLLNALRALAGEAACISEGDTLLLSAA